MCRMEKICEHRDSGREGIPGEGDHTGKGKEVGRDAGCLETLENPRWVAFPLKKFFFQVDHF